MAKLLFLRSLILSLIFVVALAPLSQGSSQGQKQPSSLTAAASSTVQYHGGPLLNKPNGINVYVIWYGGFSLQDKNSITDFLASFSAPAPRQGPSVSTWWKTISSYKDKTGKPVSTTVRLVKQAGDAYSSGKTLKRAQIAQFVKTKIASKIFPLDTNGIYLVLTSKDVTVERFCMGSCGFHESLMVGATSRVVFAHVGDPTVQCPGLCAWPYALPAYGPPGQALVAPNGLGADGMIINIATLLAGAASNPFKTGYFQGDALAPLEAVTACPGIFGAGAYPGFPGNLLVDKLSKASYNAYGANGRKFLLPAMWDLISLSCKAN
ncbi:Phosphate-induced protein 1 [Corchorus capsularis]|uniref:Phosphate-induced protein 1 n=1 Tax=Corchorus capsularis TaxID=210143 RepID=A0A1R3H0W3_COCAP|nr:Phosphate-induced protein 1 [Corchorus capsularis]